MANGWTKEMIGKMKKKAKRYSPRHIAQHCKTKRLKKKYAFTLDLIRKEEIEEFIINLIKNGDFQDIPGSAPLRMMQYVFNTFADCSGYLT